MAKTPEQLCSDLQKALGNEIAQVTVELGELCVTVPRTRIADILRILRDDPAIQMSQLVDICGVDYPERPERFDIVYNLLSMRHNARVRIKIQTDEHTPVPTSVGVFSAAGWFEREFGRRRNAAARSGAHHAGLRVAGRRAAGLTLAAQDYLPSARRLARRGAGVPAAIDAGAALPPQPGNRSARSAFSARRHALRSVAKRGIARSPAADLRVCVCMYNIYSRYYLWMRHLQNSVIFSQRSILRFKSV